MTKKMSTIEFIEKANSIHNGKYDYSKVDMDNRDDKGKIIIICPIHGEFKQMPYKHLQGQGCKKCANELDSKNKIKTIEHFIYDAKKIHGEFNQTPDEHLQGKGCPKCGMISSKYEDEICNILKGCYVIRNSKKILNNGKEIDIFLPEKNIGIEFNGLRWHSELFNRDKNYHLNKMNDCLNKGIKLIQIFEDEYLHHKNIVLNKILHIIGIEDNNKMHIGGRKCKIKEIDNKSASMFLNEFHIQGFASSTVYLGAFYGDILIGVMTFKKEEHNGKWELNRFASDYNYICQGVGGKLFKYFIRKYNPLEVKSFADKRWTINKDNNLYTNLGFALDKELYPDYRYYDPNKDKTIRFHKFLYRKQKLHRLFKFPLEMTENEMTKKIECYKIWDCGLYRYIWKKKED